MQRRRRYDLKLSLTRRKQLIGVGDESLDWLGMFSTDFPCWCCVSSFTNNPYWICLQVIWLTGWENLCLRCANRMAVSIHRNKLWFAASKDFITKMNATILIHYVLLMKDLEIFKAPSMLKWHGSGLGTSSKQAEPISPDEEAMLWFRSTVWGVNGPASQTWKREYRENAMFKEWGRWRWFKEETQDRCF